MSSTYVRHTYVRHVDTPASDGCRWCGTSLKSHGGSGYRWMKSKSWHLWQQPTTAQVMARMRILGGFENAIALRQYNDAYDLEETHYGAMQVLHARALREDRMRQLSRGIGEWRPSEP